MQKGSDDLRLVIKPVGMPQEAKAPLLDQVFTEGLEIVPFKAADLIRASLE